MEALEAILTRRSIRNYTDTPVTGEQVETLLRAAMAAPSAGNQQPWQFIVVRDRSLLSAVPGYHPYSSMLHQAPVAVVVCGDLTLEKHGGYWVQDCSAATQNLLVAARALGLGAVWLGVYPLEDRVEATRRVFELPEHIVPLAIIAIGHPDRPQAAADRYQPARVHTDRW